MQTYIRINNQIIPATISGTLKDKNWNDRASKSIHLNLPYNEIKNLFYNDVMWEIGQCSENITIPSLGEELISQPILEYYDNSDYSIVGDIIIHNDNSVTVKMGQPTTEELLIMLMEGLDL